MLEDDDRQFLYDLLNAASPTGYEAEGQRVWTEYARRHSDHIESDAYGSAWATVDGAAGAPRIMLEAHADEIGFTIKYIGDEGFIRVDRIGGTDHAIARGRRVRFQGSSGPVLGVIGNTAIHLRPREGEEKAPKVEELFVDIGAGSREEVLERGLRVGHAGVYVDAVESLTDSRLIGRALDNRLGGFVIAQALRRVREAGGADATVIAVNAVQEEIGGHGAQMVAFRLEPDLAIVVDVTHSTDTPGIEKDKHGDVRLGRGPTVTHGTVNHPRIVERLLEVAEREGIPIQHETSSRFSGTDTDVIFKSRGGVPAALVSIPLRYMHSTVETVDLGDVEQTIALLAGFVRSVTRDDAFGAGVH